MNTRCFTIQQCFAIRQRLIDENLSDLINDATVVEHLTTCDECLSFAESLNEVNALLESLPNPAISSHLVTKVLERIKQVPFEELKEVATEGFILAKFNSLKLEYVAFAKLVSKIKRRFFNSIFVTGSIGLAVFLCMLISISNISMFFGEAKSLRLSGVGMDADFSSKFSETETRSKRKLSQKDLGDASYNMDSGVIAGEKSVGGMSSPVKKKRLTSDKDNLSGVVGQIINEEEMHERKKLEIVQSPPRPSESLADARKSSSQTTDAKLGAFGTLEDGKKVVAEQIDSELKENLDKGIEANLSKGVGLISSVTQEVTSIVARDRLPSLAGFETTDVAPKPNTPAYREESGISAAVDFIAKLNSLDNLKFKEAAGYWKNTYVPGDPYYRTLYHNLSAFDKQVFKSGGHNLLALDDAAHPPKRPFDLPQNAALAVYLQANRTNITERSRMLLQVGLQATQRHSGSRPAMNVGLVLNLHDNMTVEDKRIFRSIVTAFEKAKDLGDRFSLTVAGVAGGNIISPADFRHGPVSMALQKLLGDGTTSGETLSLLNAIRNATEIVKKSDDPTAPLGSSVVILVTSSNIGREVDRITQIAQQNAINGIPFSAIGVGSNFDSSELDSIVLAGQGNRRVILNPNESESLVQRELTATSKVVARAVRLNIVLASGVKLINVLGSSRLDEQSALYVKEAEKSIDARISKNLGIEADRGADDSGIQIIIPTFYSGDSHVVLLDVVADGAGAIATVTAKFKDLAFLRNGVSKASLDLGSFPTQETPLSRNVLKNRLVVELVDVLNKASKKARQNDYAQALELLNNHYLLLKNMQTYEPEFARDIDILNDIAMISEYTMVLKGNQSILASNSHHFADSLEYAALRKCLPAPETPE